MKISRCFKSLWPAIVLAALLAGGQIHPARAAEIVGDIVVEPGVKNASNASFDCTKVTDRADQVICGNDDLAMMDKEMADAYHKLLSRISPEAANLLKRNQRQWIKQRDARCVTDVSDCGEAYRERQIEFQEFSDNPSLVIPFWSKYDQFTKAISTGTVLCRIVSHKLAGKDHLGNDVWILQTPGSDGNHGKFWLVFVQSLRIVRKQYLADLCNYTDSGVEIDSGIIKLHEWCGAMHGWERNLTMRLDTFTPLIQNGGSRGDPGYWWKWNWGKFSGEGMLPRLPDDSGFWDKYPLGNCALTLDDEHGRWRDNDLNETVKGVVLKALWVGKDTLIINVDIPPEDSLPAQRGVVEISRMISDRNEELIQFHVVDGQVTKTNIPEKPVVTIAKLDARGHKILSFRLSFPPLMALEESVGQNLKINFGIDNGVSGSQWMLSSVKSQGSGDMIFSINPQLARCVPENGTLNVKYNTEFNPDEPLF
jgi:uncharacterized protein YecT (DUF1311 family)